ncbi:MAG: hypothetical protein FWE79_02230, partial [Firmicutes bacterium]|nr:hypothetical protein [Bacillota bacterium]
MRNILKRFSKRIIISSVFLIAIPLLFAGFLISNFRSDLSHQNIMSTQASAATVTLTIENGIGGTIRQIVLDAGTSINQSAELNVIDAVQAGHFFNGWRVPSIAPFPVTTWEINNRVWNTDTTIIATWGVLNPTTIRFEDGFGAPT